MYFAVSEGKVYDLVKIYEYVILVSFTLFKYTIHVPSRVLNLIINKAFLRLFHCHVYS